MQIEIKSLARSRLSVVAGVIILLGTTACSTTNNNVTKTDSVLIQPQAETSQKSIDKDDLYEFLVADLSTQRQNHAQATNNYYNLARRNQNVTLAELAFRSAMQTGDRAKARQALELWSNIDPEDERAAATITQLYLGDKQVDEAYTKVKQIRDARSKEEGKGFTYVARLLAGSRQRQEAMEVMNRLVADYPQDLDAAFAKSYLAAQFGQYQVAEVALEPVLQSRPKDQQVILQKTLVLRRLEKNDEASKFLADAVDAQPNNFDLRSTYARILLDAERYEEALEQYKRLAELNPENEEVIFAAGLISLQLQQVDDAETQFMALYNRGSVNPDVFYNLARIAEVREDIDAALRWYAQVSGGQNYPEAQIRIAVLTALQGDIATARAQLGVLRTNIPAMALQTQLTEGGLLQDAGRYDEAIAVYTEALKNNPRNTQLLYSRSLAYAQLDLFDLFEADAQAILAVDPNNADALNALGYYLADSTDRYEEAEGYIKRALELKGESHFILDSYGWLQFRLGNYDEALSYIRRALEIQADTEISAHLGEILWAKGEKEEARRVWREAFKLDPENKVLKEVMQRFGL